LTLPLSEAILIKYSKERAMKKTRRPQAPKPRTHKILFTHDSPFGHKVQKDRGKEIPRKQKYKGIDPDDG